MIPVLCLIAVALVVLRTKVREFFPYDEYYCINEVCTYFGFFVFGMIVRKYENKTWHLLEKPYVLLGLFVCLIVFFFLIYKADEYIHINLSKTFSRYILGIPIILIVFNYFHQKREYFSGNGRFNRIFRLIGRRTLDIYMLHYFFIYPAIPKLGKFLESYNNEALTIIICGSLTIVVVALCLLVSSILRSSKEVSYWLFGVKLAHKV